MSGPAASADEFLEREAQLLNSKALRRVILSCVLSARIFWKSPTLLTTLLPSLPSRARSIGGEPVRAAVAAVLREPRQDEAWRQVIQPVAAAEAKV